MKNNSSNTVIDNHNMIEEIRQLITISNVNMYILCDLNGQCLNHGHVVYAYMGAECSKL